jgi:hypothetical protein
MLACYQTWCNMRKFINNCNEFHRVTSVNGYTKFGTSKIRGIVLAHKYPYSLKVHTIRLMIAKSLYIL